MTKTIAVAGKGGTGKTTFAALVIRYLVQKKEAILALDADPNSNLNEALGLTVDKTIAEILEATKNPKEIPDGMTKHMYIEYMLSQAIVESELVDILIMGGPQGPGCYCYPNDILKGNIETLTQNYEYIVVDNEAGMEHLSRGTVKKVDHLFVISDSSVRGIRSAGRIKELVDSLQTQITNLYLVVTKIEDKGQLSILMPEIEKTNLNYIGYIPFDEMITEFDINANPLFNLPENSKAVQAVNDILKHINF